MILIQQDNTLDEQKLGVVLNKIGTTSFNINRTMIEDDIKRVSNTETLTKIADKNKSNTLKYLTRLLDKTSSEEIEVSWVASKNKIYSYPIEFKNIQQLKVLTTDYINIAPQEQMVYFDYSDLAKIIAFSIMHRDFDISMTDIEEKLANIGIITTYDPEPILNLIDSNILNLYKVMKIHDSPYLSEDRKKIFSYFLDKDFTATGYREVCEYSFNQAIAMIVLSILTKCLNFNLNFKLCSVFETGFYILFGPGTELDIEKSLGETALVRIFGRKFEVKPKLHIYRVWEA